MTHQIYKHINIIIMNFFSQFLITQTFHADKIFNFLLENICVNIIFLIQAVANNFKFICIGSCYHTKSYREYGMLSEICRKISQFNFIAALVISCIRFNIFNKFLIFQVRSGCIFAGHIQKIQTHQRIARQSKFSFIIRELRRLLIIHGRFNRISI